MKILRGIRWFYFVCWECSNDGKTKGRKNRAKFSVIQCTHWIELKCVGTERVKERERETTKKPQCCKRPLKICYECVCMCVCVCARVLLSMPFRHSKIAHKTYFIHTIFIFHWVLSFDFRFWSGYTVLFTTTTIVTISTYWNGVCYIYCILQVLTALAVHQNLHYRKDCKWVTSTQSNLKWCGWEWHADCLYQTTPHKIILFKRKHICA